MSLRGHLWTIRPVLLHKLRPRTPPPSEPWSAVVEDPDLGPVHLRGRLVEPPDARACLVIVHGLGGDPESSYCIDAALAAAPRGLASLRLGLRGSDGRGEDFYNAGLTADLHAAIASPALARFEAIYILGYSLGGHLTLRAATEERLDPRVRAVAAVCAPLDLSLSADALDRPELFLYRRHILASLKRMYAALSLRRRLVPVREANRIRSLRTWDDRIVAPRFGFAGAEDYYTYSAVAPRLALLRVPSLLAVAEGDPMVPPDTLRAALAAPHPKLEVRWLEEGGHVGFPGALALGLPAPLGLEPQVIAWLHAPPPDSGR